MTKSIAVIGSESGHLDQRLRSWALMASQLGSRVLFCSRYGDVQADPLLPRQNIAMCRYALDHQEAAQMKARNPNPALIRSFDLPLLRHWKRFFLSDLIRIQTKPCLDSFQPDLVIACGLNSLPTALSLKKRTGCRVIYDSAELEMHRNTKSSFLLERKRQLMEEEAVRGLDGIVVPSPSIADHLSQVYSLKKRPAVIRNLPFSNFETPKNSFDGNSSEQGTVKQIIYVGYRGPGRGLEALLCAMAELPEHYHLKCIGGHHSNMEKRLWSLMESQGLIARVELCDPVPPEKILQTIGSADVSFIGVENKCLSYFYSLPNKLFQSLLAGIPVVAPAFPDINEVVEASRMGICFEDFTKVDIAAALVEACELKEKADWPEKCENLAKKLDIQKDMSLLKAVLLDS